MTETIDPKDIRVGDRVTVTGIIKSVADDGVRVALDGSTHTTLLDSDELTAATITRPVDPDVLLVRREMAKAWPREAGLFESGNLDTCDNFKAALAAVKAVRAEIG